MPPCHFPKWLPRKALRASWVISGLILLVASGCDSDTQSPTAKRERAPSRRVVTTSYPFQYLAQRLGGDSIDVTCPATAADNPRTWLPAPADIQSMQAADLIITGGQALPYAEWIGKVSLPESKICNGSRALKLSDFIHIEDYRVVHQHGPEGEHSHPLLIPYLWLDPAMVRKEVALIAQALADTYPELSASIDQSKSELDQQLEELSRQLKEIDMEGQQVLLTTPNLCFLARALGVERDYLMWIESPGSAEETAKRLEEIRSRLGDNSSVLILASGDYATDLLQSSGLAAEHRVVAIDLLDHPPGEGDLLSELKSMIAALQQAAAKPGNE